METFRHVGPAALR